MKYATNDWLDETGKKFELIFFDEGEFPDFMIEWVKITEFYAEFIIHEPTSLNMDKTPMEWEKYISGTIKWDGCSHFYFGDKDGYIHLCGKHYFTQHCNMVTAIFDLCSKRIEKFDNEAAS